MVYTDARVCVVRLPLCLWGGKGFFALCIVGNERSSSFLGSSQKRLLLLLVYTVRFSLRLVTRESRK